MNPVIFQVGPFALQWYGVFIVGGAAIAAWLSGRYAARAGENPDHIWNLLAWTLLLGIIGARAYHVFSSPAGGGGWSYYRQNPIAAINFWNGGFRGLGIYGGLIGGLIAIILYTWRQKLNVWKYLDFIAPNIFLAQAIGRMGNFVNQELYGQPTTVPWAFHINPRFSCMVPENLPAGVQACGSPSLTQQTLDWFASNGFHPTLAFWGAAAPGRRRLSLSDRLSPGAFLGGDVPPRCVDHRFVGNGPMVCDWSHRLRHRRSALASPGLARQRTSG